MLNPRRSLSLLIIARTEMYVAPFACVLSQPSTHVRRYRLPVLTLSSREIRSLELFNVETGNYNARHDVDANFSREEAPCIRISRDIN